MVSLVNDIESEGYFRAFEFVHPLIKANQLNNSDISFLARHIFDYLLLADRLGHLPPRLPAPAVTATRHLIAGTTRDSDEVPLRIFSTPEDEVNSQDA
ncbi:hypothetical protein B2J96_23355 [Mycobacterium shigaense]|nr:hypothetical protein B2J96_23355 [Mycobacterium shigaense]